MKNYVGIVRDHSGSMASVAKAAAEDYNNIVKSLLASSAEEQIDTIVTVVECGTEAKPVNRAIVNSSVNALKAISGSDYHTKGRSTPLFDAVGELISLMSAVPDADDPEVTFLILAITDGEENASKAWSGPVLSKEIKKLQGTDRWTFTFRVPVGYEGALQSKLGISSGNVLGWQTTEKGFAASGASTRASIGAFYKARASGIKSSKSFYTSMADVSRADVRAALTEITGDIVLHKVSEDINVTEFSRKYLKKPIVPGTIFYQLMKRENKVQDYKRIIVRDKKSAKAYQGEEARAMLGLPTTGDVPVIPGDHGNFEIFIQSTSLNRKLPAGTKAIYWEAAGAPAFMRGAA